MTPKSATCGLGLVIKPLWALAIKVRYLKYQMNTRHFSGLLSFHVLYTIYQSLWS